MQNKPRSKLEPLKITCTSTDCDNELHCFKKSREMTEEERGICRSCGADLVKWERVHQKKLSDVSYTFEALRHEYFRHYYWHKEIDQRARNHARRKGRSGLRERVRIELAKKVGPAKPFRDGTQTPLEGNIIYYAQHALACCCRTCMEYWHGIQKGVELTDDELDYFVELVMCYINDRMPDLTEYGEPVPHLRTKE